MFNHRQIAAATANGPTARSNCSRARSFELVDWVGRFLGILHTTTLLSVGKAAEAVAGAPASDDHDVPEHNDKVVFNQ